MDFIATPGTNYLTNPSSIAIIPQGQKNENLQRTISYRNCITFPNIYLIRPSSCQTVDKDQRRA